MKDEKRFKYDNNLETLTDVFVRSHLEEEERGEMGQENTDINFS